MRYHGPVRSYESWVSSKLEQHANIRRLRRFLATRLPLVLPYTVPTNTAIERPVP
jgi:hypothetical protein